MAQFKTIEEVQAIIESVKFLDRQFRVLPKGDGYLLQLQYMEADIHTNKEELQGSRKWYISPYATESEIVETAFACVQRSMLHVIGEHFLYKGKRVYSPHFSIEERINLCNKDSFDSRD
jgi:hypothetical protein